MSDSTSNPFVDWTTAVVGGYLELEKIKNPAPAAPQPDSAGGKATYPSQPDTVYSGSDAAMINTGNTGHTMTIGGVAFDKRFLAVSATALGVVAFIKLVQ